MVICQLTKLTKAAGKNITTNQMKQKITEVNVTSLKYYKRRQNIEMKRKQSAALFIFKPFDWDVRVEWHKRYVRVKCAVRTVVLVSLLVILALLFASAIWRQHATKSDNMAIAPPTQIQI